MLQFKIQKIMITFKKKKIISKISINPRKHFKYLNLQNASLIIDMKVFTGQGEHEGVQH